MQHLADPAAHHSFGFLVAIMSDTGHPGVLATVAKLGYFALIALPISIGIGILRYRLYEIDRLVSRTLSYAILTGLLVGVYFSVGLAACADLIFRGDR